MWPSPRRHLLFYDLGGQSVIIFVYVVFRQMPQMAFDTLIKLVSPLNNDRGDKL